MEINRPDIQIRNLRIAMLSIHSSPIGPLGSQNTGGMSVYIRELAHELGLAGHHVDIFTSNRETVQQVALSPNVRLIHLDQLFRADQPLGSDQPRGADRHRGLQIDKEALCSFLPDVFNALERFRRSEQLTYDLIHSHYWISGVVGAMAQMNWRCPHTVMFHTLGIVKNRTASAEHESDRRIAHERWLAKMADHIIAPANREQENLLRFYHAHPERISVIPCGVNLDMFRPQDPLASRLKLGFDPQAKIILYVGRFAPLKNLDKLLGAVALLKRQWPGIRLVIVGGDGPDAENFKALERLAGQLGVQSQVTFAGRVQQHKLPPYYNAADLLVLPSHYESFGLVVLEALACGTPVAVTPVGAVESILRNDISGTLIQSTAVEDVAEGIARILSRPAAKKPTAELIRSTVREFSWPRIASSVVDIYQTLVEAPLDERSRYHSAGSPLPI
jgi:D-inositol-3-phosphate glycosyltransferase